jgi:hypothetical protein
MVCRIQWLRLVLAVEAVAQLRLFNYWPKRIGDGEAQPDQLETGCAKDRVFSNHPKLFSPILVAVISNPKITIFEITTS